MSLCRSSSSEMFALFSGQTESEVLALLSRQTDMVMSTRNDPEIQKQVVQFANMSVQCIMQQRQYHPQTKEQSSSRKEPARRRAVILDGNGKKYSKNNKKSRTLHESFFTKHGDTQVDSTDSAQALLLPHKIEISTEYADSDDEESKGTSSKETVCSSPESEHSKRRIYRKRTVQRRLKFGYEKRKNKEKLEEITARKKKAAENTYRALWVSTTQFIENHNKESQTPNYLESLTTNCFERYRNHIREVDFKNLNAIANTLHKDTAYDKEVKLATFCMTKLKLSIEDSEKDTEEDSEEDSEEDAKKNTALHSLSSFYFFKAIHGAADSDPAKWGPLKRIIIIAFIVILVSLLAGFAISYGWGIIDIGLHAASSTPFTAILQHGWNLLLPYKFIIPIVSGIANQLLVIRFFGKSLTQKKIDIYDKSVPQPAIDNYPDYFTSMQLLYASINCLKEDNKIKANLLTLYRNLNGILSRARADADNEDREKIKYLMPILFAATAFAKNLNKKHSSTELIKLSFHALKGAGLAEPPGQSTWKLLLGRALPVIIIIGIAACLAFFWLSSIHAFLVLNTVVSVLSECFSLIPKDMLPTEHQERANKILKNGITQSISEIEEELSQIKLQLASSHGKIKKLAPLPKPPVPSTSDRLPINYTRDSYNSPQPLHKNRLHTENGQKPVKNSLLINDFSPKQTRK